MFFHHLMSALAGITITIGNALGLCALPSQEQVNSYLYARYVETPKEDTSGNFEGKDAKAAAFAGKTVEQYAIECVDWSLRQRVYFLMQSFDAQGIYIGITSGYRDDKRQAMITGRNKNAPGHSFHGGSLVGGCGHGDAMDLVALAPTRELILKRSLELWAKIDREGKVFGLGRPYGDHDAPHVAPLESHEFAVAAARLKARAKRIRLAKLRKAKAKKLAHQRAHKKIHVASS